MTRALGIVPHTGWAACVVASGSLARPAIAARERIELLDAAERFVFHRAAELPLADAETWIATVRAKALAAATRALAHLVEAYGDVTACAIVAKRGTIGALAAVLAAHATIHGAESCFYRDILTAAVTVPVRVIAPSSLDPRSPAVAAAGALVGRPWAMDQKLAALAAWHVLSNP